MEKKMYNEVLAELERVFNGSSMVTIGEYDGMGRIIVTFEKGVEFWISSLRLGMSI